MALNMGRTKSSIDLASMFNCCVMLFLYISVASGLNCDNNNIITFFFFIFFSISQQYNNF